MRPFPASPRHLAAAAGLFGPLLLACTIDAPREPEDGSFRWISYVNHAAGFELEIPDGYRLHEEAEGRAVLWRTADGVPVKVYWLTEREGAGRGLWFDEEATGTTRIGGVDGLVYRYRHCDGPLCSWMESYVIPHRGRSLALEFRTDGPLHRTNRRILKSFTPWAPAQRRSNTSDSPPSRNAITS